MSFHTAVVEQALRTLFEAKHFSICSVDNLAALLGSNAQQHPDYKALRCLHCVNYADMKPEILAELPGRVARVLRPGFDVDAAALAFALTAEGQHFTPAEDRYIDAPGRVTMLPRRK